LFPPASKKQSRYGDGAGSLRSEHATLQFLFPMSGAVEKLPL